MNVLGSSCGNKLNTKTNFIITSRLTDIKSLLIYAKCRNVCVFNFLATNNHRISQKEKEKIQFLASIVWFTVKLGAATVPRNTCKLVHAVCIHKRSKWEIFSVPVHSILMQLTLTYWSVHDHFVTLFICFVCLFVDFEWKWCDCCSAEFSRNLCNFYSLNIAFYYSIKCIHRPWLCIAHIANEHFSCDWSHFAAFSKMLKLLSW